MREWCFVFYTAYMQDFQYCRLAGDNRVSYTNCKRNAFQHDPSVIASIKNAMLPCRCSHRIHSICLPNSAACDLLISSISYETTCIFLRYVLSAIVLCHFIGADASQQTNFLDIVFSCSQVSSLPLSLIIC